MLCFSYSIVVYTPVSGGGKTVTETDELTYSTGEAGACWNCGSLRSPILGLPVQFVCYGFTACISLLDAAMSPKITVELLRQLRQAMRNTKYIAEPIQAYIVPSGDAHQVLNTHTQGHTHTHGCTHARTHICTHTHRITN